MFVLAAMGERPDAGLDARLRREVAALAGRWAVATAAPGLAFVSDRIEGASVDGAAAFGEPGRDDLPAVLAAVLGGHGGPVLLVAADVPRLDAELAEAALADVTSGCALSFAPATDARPFLLALASPAPELLAFAGARERDRSTLGAAAMALGGDVGLLRSERRLVTPEDARALAIDPLIPDALRSLAR